MLMLANEFDAALRSSTTQNVAKSLSLISYTGVGDTTRLGVLHPIHPQ